MKLNLRIQDKWNGLGISECGNGFTGVSTILFSFIFVLGNTLKQVNIQLSNTYNQESVMQTEVFILYCHITFQLIILA